MILFNIQHENDEIVYLQNKRINNKTTKTKHATKLELKGPFPLRAWKRAFFVSFIDLRLKRAQKKSNKTNKECFFSRS